MNNVLGTISREQFYHWLAANHKSQSECWTELHRGKTAPADGLWYIDSVYVALCFGWIDSVNKRVDGVLMQRFTPRTRRSPWSELNKERCRYMQRRGLMTDAGRDAWPDMSPHGFVIAADIAAEFRRHRRAWRLFNTFPPLYRRVRIDTIQRDRSDPAVVARRLARLIAASDEGRMIGEWDDYGRLSEPPTGATGWW